MKKWLRRARVGAVVSSVAAATLIAPPAAQAAGSFDVYDIRAESVRVNFDGCRNVTITARTDAPSWITDVDAYVDVRVNGGHVDEVWLEEYPSVNRLRGHYFYCPNLDEVGTYKLGPSQVTAYDDDWNGEHFIDRSTGTMLIKQATRAKVTATRSGNLRKFTVRPRYFSVGYGWYRYPTGQRVHLQRRPANGSGVWKRVDTARVDKRGTARLQKRAAKSFQYRVTSPGTARSWSLQTKTIRR